MESLIYPFILLTYLMTDSSQAREIDILSSDYPDSRKNPSKDPIIPEFITTSTKNNSLVCPLLKDKENLTEEKLSQEQAELDLMWDKIQELKLIDSFAAQVLYEKYKARAGELPPPIPT